MIGHKIPLNNPAWDVNMCLKEKVELVVVPTQSKASTSNLDTKISFDSDYMPSFLRLS